MDRMSAGKTEDKTTFATWVVRILFENLSLTDHCLLDLLNIEVFF